MQMDSGLTGQELHDLGRRLWPIHRSITGDGTRLTLKILQESMPHLKIHEVPSGTQAFDWTIPDEWNPKSAQLFGPDGEIVVDYSDNNLHIVGYSNPVDVELSLEELQAHLHSIPEQPNAIPYVTSYYHPSWGFCIPHRVREKLKPGKYRALIDSRIEPGSLTYGELVLPGRSDDEVLISTYVCHPSMANNELSGPLVATGVASWLIQESSRHYTYRFVFVPESIGALTFASRELDTLRAKVVAGFQLTCIGDDRHFTYLASRRGNTRTDAIARRAMANRPNAVEYSYLHRGSDERTYCAPGLDLPLVSLMRTRYGDFVEYHTSEDDLDNVVTPVGLQGGVDLVKDCIRMLESEDVLYATTVGEPQLGRRNLYHRSLNKHTPAVTMLRTNVLAFADGQHSVEDIAFLTGAEVSDLRRLVDELVSHELLTVAKQQPVSRSEEILKSLSTK